MEIEQNITEWSGGDRGLGTRTGIQGHKERVKIKDRGMGRDKNRNRDTGTVIGVGPDGKGPRHRDRKGNQSRYSGTQEKGQEQKRKDTVIVTETRIVIEGRRVPLVQRPYWWENGNVKARVN